MSEHKLDCSCKQCKVIAFTPANLERLEQSGVLVSTASQHLDATAKKLVQDVYAVEAFKAALAGQKSYAAAQIEKLTYAHQGKLLDATELLAKQIEESMTEGLGGDAA